MTLNHARVHCQYHYKLKHHFNINITVRINIQKYVQSIQLSIDDFKFQRFTLSSFTYKIKVLNKSKSNQ